MVYDIDFLWKQLNGPQATAFTQALYLYLKDQFDSLLDYFNNLSIGTADSEHLTLMGILANFSRPSIRYVDLAFFWFTEEYQHNFIHGFGSLEDHSLGGKFASLTNVYESEHSIPLGDQFFRIVLQAYADSVGEIGSLQLMDDILYALQQRYGSNATYEFEIVQELSDQHDIGDMRIDLGSMTSWNQPDAIIASIEAIANTAYAPLPRVWPAYTS
jgi:hypothetical protein